MGRQRTGPVELIVVHHSASNDTYTNLEALIAERRHRNEGYNVIVDDDDALRSPAKGKDGKADWKQDAPDGEISNGTYGVNSRAWNICIDGNFEHQTPTDDEVNTLIQIIAAKAKKFGWKKRHVKYIIGHQEAGLKYSATKYVTACPGKNLIAKLPFIRERVATYLEG